MKMKEMKIMKDGDSWCFVLPDFENLQISPAYFIDDFCDIKLKHSLNHIYKILKAERKSNINKKSESENFKTYHQCKNCPFYDGTRCSTKMEGRCTRTYEN